MRRVESLRLRAGRGASSARTGAVFARAKRGFPLEETLPRVLVAAMARIAGLSGLRGSWNDPSVLNAGGKL